MDSRCLHGIELVNEEKLLVKMSSLFVFCLHLCRVVVHGEGF